MGHTIREQIDRASITDLCPTAQFDTGAVSKNYKYKGRETEYKKEYSIKNRRSIYETRRLRRSQYRKKETEYARIWRMRHKEQKQEQWNKYQVDYRVKNKEYILRKEIERKNGITQERYMKILSLQGNVCAICKKAEKAKSSNGDKIKRLAVDHDHKTGEIRGLLCNKCNVMLGMALDNPLTLRSAADYIDHKP